MEQSKATQVAKMVRARFRVSYWIGAIALVIMGVVTFVAWVAFVAFCVRLAQAWGWL